MGFANLITQVLWIGKTQTQPNPMKIGNSESKKIVRYNILKSICSQINKTNL